MHTGMAALRATGAALKDSSIQESRIDDNRYLTTRLANNNMVNLGSQTFQKITDCSHDKNSSYELYWEELLRRHPDFEYQCSSAANIITTECCQVKIDNAR